MNKHFTFKDVSWWDNPPCDCCESCLYDSYNCISHEEIYRSLSSWTDIYQTILFVVTGVDLDDRHTQEASPYYNMNFDQLEAECTKLGITVEIIE
jgi:hypothetical protein